VKSLRSFIGEAESKKSAIGHFNISNLEGLWGIFNAARKLDLPVVIGVSEGERNFVGVRQAVALVRSLRESYSHPVFLNADHTYTLEGVREAIDSGFDAVILDGAKLAYEENVKLVAQAVEYGKSMTNEVLVEGELGYIGSSSKLLDEIPEGATASEEQMTKPEQARDFVKKTGVDLLAPAVGNLHGILKHAKNPALDIERIGEIRKAAGVPLVLHGGSGVSDEDFVKAIRAGISVVHINSEIRLAYRKAIEKSLADNPDEIAPYKYLKAGVEAIEGVVEARLGLFAKKS